MKFDRNELFKNIAWLGGTLLLAGFLRYQIQEELLTTSKIMLIAGAVLFVVGVAFNFRGVLAFFSRRGTKLGANTALLTVAVLAILVLANFVGYRHSRRFDLTSEKLFSLSDQTRKIVTGLQRDVKVIKFAESDDVALHDLMAEYRSLSHHVEYLRINPLEKPEISRQYGISQPGEAVMASGTRIEHLTAADEQELTTALLKVTRDALKTVCFVEGHGEKSLSSTEATGYSLAESELKRENYLTKSVNLTTENQVPADCGVLVIAGPVKSFFPQEASLVEQYLGAGGKAMVMLDPDTDPKLDDLFTLWNIIVGKDTVVDASGRGQILGLGAAAPLVADYGLHPITKNFGRTMSFFPLARSVRRGPKPSPDEQAVELLQTSPASFAKVHIKGDRVQFDPKEDLRGPVSLGIAAGRKSGEKEARLVVIGDSDFASNRFVGAARNGDIFFNSINWLAQDEDLISIRPKSATGRKVNLTRTQQNMLFWFTNVLLPGAVLVAGVVLWWKRR